MIKHTPGPWRWSGAYLIQSIGRIILKATKYYPGEYNEALIALAPTAPHECDDPKCPGNINRRKLELYDELVELVRLANMDLCSDCRFKKPECSVGYNCPDRMRRNNILAKAESIEKGEQP